MKHLKIRGELVNEVKNKVKVTILEQSHVQDEFGQSWGREGDTRMFEKGGYGLYAPKGWQPSVYKDGSFYGGTLFLISEEVIKDASEAKSFTCTLEEYKHLKELVIEYNEWGANQ
jgi:hypothetical protein